MVLISCLLMVTAGYLAHRSWYSLAACVLSYFAGFLIGTSH